MVRLSHVDGVRAGWYVGVAYPLASPVFLPRRFSVTFIIDRVFVVSCYRIDLTSIRENT